MPCLLFDQNKAATAGSDPNAAQVLWYIKDGVFSDAGPAGRSITPTAGVTQVDNYFSFSGTNSTITLGATDSLYHNTNPFTVELDFWPVDHSNRAYFRSNIVSNDQWLVHQGNTSSVTVFQEAAIWSNAGGGLITLNARNTLSIMRTGATWTLHINGTRVSSNTVSNLNSLPAVIGAATSRSDYNGRIYRARATAALRYPTNANYDTSTVMIW
jgi:hypothetical protein